MRFCVVGLNMLKLRRLLERGNVPITIPQPVMNSRITRSNISDVTLKMLDIDRIKSDYSREKPNVRLSNIGPKIEGLALFLGLGEMRLDSVEGSKERCYGFTVGFLRCCEAGSVDAVVDVVVSPFICGFDFGAKRRWVEIDCFIGGREEVVESIVEHADNFRALFVHLLIFLARTRG